MRPDAASTPPNFIEDTMRMFTLLIICSMYGCSTFGSADEPPNSKLLVDKEVRGMTRNEVIYGINECEANKTRAVVIMAKQKISGRITDVVTDVTCMPRYQY